VALYELALELKGDASPGFTVPAAWRDMYYQRLVDAGVELERPLFDGASDLVDRWIASRVASLAFGDSAAFRRQVDRDAQVQMALDLLGSGRTLSELFALAEQRRDSASGPSN
jgi:hypothetical protein